MIPGWVLALTILFVILFGVVIALQIKITTQNDVILRAIPLGSPKVMERRPPGPPELREPRETRPVGSTSTASGRHG